MVDLFETSQQYKAKIEQSPDLMKNLAIYAQHIPNIPEHPLPELGRGMNNSHYRIGQLKSGLYVATRENFRLSTGQDQKIAGEIYAENLEYAHDEGKLTSKFLVGVRVHSGKGLNRDRCFFLLEDFTKGDTANFEPGKSTEETGTIDGKVVHYDFDEDSYSPPDLKYMHDDAMIHIHLNR